MSDDPEVDLVQLARGDHNEEVHAYVKALDAVVDRYWFIGKAEIIGGLERVKFINMNAWARDSE